MRFFLFLTFFLSLYGGLHLYCYGKLRRAFELAAPVKLACIFFMLVMLLAPILTRLLERNHLELPARYVAYCGYIWMGFLFLFFASGLVVDIVRILVKIAMHLLPVGGHLQISALQAFMVPLLVAFVIISVGFYDALNIRVEKITIPTPKLPPGARLKIAQISDVHLGLIVSAARLQRIVKKIEAANPDVLVSTGDLVDGRLGDPGEITGMLRRIPTRYGKFAVTGNHEFYVGLNQALKVTREAGFRVLRGEGLNIAGLFSIAGVDDPTGDRLAAGQPVSERALRSGLPDDQFAILLKHQPQLANGSQGFFDLQLSGHTHKGQIFPFGLIVTYFYPYDSGLFTLANQSYLYVSRGTGTWGPPIRFLSPPEVTVFELVATPNKKG